MTGDGLTKVPVDIRREHIASWMATPPALRVSKKVLADFLGVTPLTVSNDMKRDEVLTRATAISTAAVGVLVQESSVSCIASLAVKAAEGDVAASRELRGWLKDAGMLGNATSVEADPETGVVDVTALASTEARKALLALHQTAYSDPETAE